MAIYGLWQDYWKRAQAVLHDRPVTLQDVEAASEASTIVSPSRNMILGADKRRDFECVSPRP